MFCRQTGQSPWSVLRVFAQVMQTHKWWHGTSRLSLAPSIQTTHSVGGAAKNSPETTQWHNHKKVLTYKNLTRLQSSFFVSYFYFSRHCDGDLTPNTLDQVCRRRISPSSDLKLTNMYEESARRMRAGLDEKREKGIIPLFFPSSFSPSWRNSL